MRLSSKTEYALLALIFLSRLEKDQYIHGLDIAKSQNIPISFLQQILFTLKQARLVKSVKGKNGGYALTKSPTQISMAEILRLFDGPIAPSRSVSKYYHEKTPISGEKKVTFFLKEIRDYLSKKLENTFLSDLN